MKYMLALTIVALAAVGCGHGSQDRSQPATTPGAASQLAKATLDADSAALTGKEPTFAQVASGDINSPADATPMNDSDVTFYRDQSRKQHAILVAQQRLLDQAIATKNNAVKLTPELLDLTIYSAGSGFLGMNAYQGFKKLAIERAAAAEHTASGAEVAASEGAAVSDAVAASRLARWGKAVSSYAVEGAPYVGRTFEGAVAVIGAYYTIGKLINTADGVWIRFTDTQEIKDLRAKVDVARTNLEATNKNLAVLRDSGTTETP